MQFASAGISRKRLWVLGKFFDGNYFWLASQIAALVLSNCYKYDTQVSHVLSGGYLCSPILRVRGRLGSGWFNRPTDLFYFWTGLSSPSPFGRRDCCCQVREVEEEREGE